MSESLKQFLSEWLAWAEVDAPEHGAFVARFGLCSNLDFWIKGHRMAGRMSGDSANMLSDEFETILEREFKEDCAYPFGSVDIYVSDCSKRAHHKNEARLAWVREQLGK